MARPPARHETPPAVKRRGLMFVLSSPSGAGKSTLSRMLLEDPGVELSISVTTRPRRPGEVDGKHYHFIDKAKVLAGRSTSNALRIQSWTRNRSDASV